MIGFIIFLLISIGFWVYTTKIDTNFIANTQDKLLKYTKDFIKKATPSSDSMFDNNVTLMKMNLYLLAFNKNLELYNKLYNADELSFLGTSNKNINLSFSDIANLIPGTLPISEDILKSKLEMSFKNNLGFSGFFIDLCDKGVYLTDYSIIFINLLKPILIIKSLTITQEQKIEKLNNINAAFEHTADNLNTIIVNVQYIVDIIYNLILILTNITIDYKEIIDLNDQIYSISIEDYSSKKAIIMNKINSYKSQFDTYLNNNSFEYSYMKTYIDSIFNFEQFILMQEFTNYIIIHKMLKGIDTFAGFDNYVGNTVLPYLNKLDL